jgi:predicted nucleic acid-binding protein
VNPTESDCVAYLVDTDILIDYLRRQEPAADYLDSLGEWSLSVVSGMELVAGALNNDEVREIDTILATYPAAPMNLEIGQLDYNLMKTYSKSNGIDPCGAMIAATAIYEGLKLSTKNDKHFRDIGGLEMEVPKY